VLVLVEDAAESVMSADVEVVEPVRFGDWLGEWAQGRRGVERAVGPVLVVEGFVLAERVQEVGLVSRSEYGRGVRLGMSAPSVP
jgi:hypothetical protein